jgi:hypothetical protein
MALTLDLPAAAQARLQAEANRRGVTLDQLVTEIADTFAEEPSNSKLPFVGAGASKSGITHRIDEMLSEGFGQD